MCVVLRAEGEAVVGCGAPEDDLGPLQEEDVPDAQQVVKGQRVRKQRDEPVRAEHGRQHTLPLQVRPHPRNLQDNSPSARGGTAGEHQTSCRVLDLSEWSVMVCPPACFQVQSHPWHLQEDVTSNIVTSPCKMTYSFQAALRLQTPHVYHMQRLVLTGFLPQNRQGPKTGTDTAAAGAGQA